MRMTSPVDGSEVIRNRLPASVDTPDLGTKGNQEGDRVRSTKRSRTIARQDRVRGSSVRGREITTESTGKPKRPKQSRMMHRMPRSPNT